jgi:hypothetical protein
MLQIRSGEVTFLLQIRSGKVTFTYVTNKVREGYISPVRREIKKSFKDVTFRSYQNILVN